MSHGQDDTPGPGGWVELSKKTEVRTNIGVMVAIIGATALGVAAWVHLELKVETHESTLTTLAIEVHQDHDILTKLDARTEWLSHTRLASPTSAIVPTKSGNN